MIRRIIFFVTLGIIIGSTLRAQESTVPDTVETADNIRVETTVDRSEIYIGDLISYDLTIYYDSALTLSPPPIGANLGAFDVKDYEINDPVDDRDGWRMIKSHFKLTTFTTGDYILPPIPIEYMLSDSTNRVIISEPISIRVKSLIGEGATDTLDVKDLKPQYAFKRSNLWLWWTIAGVLILGLTAAFLIWRRKTRGRGPSEPVDLRDPWEIAFEKLAGLKEKDYLEKKKYKQYYVELGDLFREYIGRIYGFAALDMTTDEFLYELEEIEMEPALYDRIKKFLNHADLIKFAKFEPDESRPMFDFDEVHEMITYVREIELTKRSQIEQIEMTAPKEESGV